MAFAEFIATPVSGQYEEKIFDVDTVWRGPMWSWVRFTKDDGEEWCGSFRGTPERLAVPENGRLIGVLTSQSFYVVDIEEKSLQYFEEQTEIKECLITPDAGIFIIAGYYSIWLINVKDNFNEVPVKVSEYMDTIWLLGLEDGKVEIEFEDYRYEAKRKATLDLGSQEFLVEGEKDL